MTNPIAQEQEAILRHAIGQELFDYLDWLSKDIWELLAELGEVPG